ncbi:hypothetical protein OV208_08110 [Corallococcus sp. bb12-1]|uniref:hypothetical protein n=1 Tax=Corallococcus sp. bb12-1 TaxID=2996784 RepID=UPI00226D922B|nr:hypothetical protein [Corallococcus sp. bb12-1]MCY1041279.1 hypothetical protein [Corallococcus sp. bb12-1]
MPLDAFPDDAFVVDPRMVENKHVIEFSLAAKCDLEGARIPLRIITQLWPWEYRDEGCGCAGPPVMRVNDTPTSSLAEERCGKCLTSCMWLVDTISHAVIHRGGATRGPAPGPGLLQEELASILLRFLRRK